MNAPTASEIRTASRIDFESADYNYPTPTGSDPDPLQQVIDQAVSYVVFVVGRPLDTGVPTSLEPLVTQAVRMRVEQIVGESKTDTVETAADYDMLTAFNAGPYSETRRGLTDNEAKAGMINAWPALNRLLWLLLGLAPGEVNDTVDERRDYWRYILGLAPAAPAWQVIEMQWRSSVEDALVESWQGFEVYPATSIGWW